MRTVYFNNMARRRIVAAVVTVLLAFAVLPSGSMAAQATAGKACGFYFTNPDHDSGVTARYDHCGDSFILIRIDWSEGSHYRACVYPWSSEPFWPDGPHRVVNAYYVPVAPNLIDYGGGQHCSLTQPQE